MFIMGIESELNSHFNITKYRRKNFIYSVGDYCYADGAPIWVILRCNQAGTTSKEDIDFSLIVNEGEIITDGTVKWKVEDLRLKDLEGPIGIGISSESVGRITWQYDLLENYLLLDGGSVESFYEQYQDLYDFLEERNLITETKSAYDANKALWYYNNSTDVMMKANFLDKTVWGGVEVIEKKSGLPNIKGAFRLSGDFQWSDPSNWTGTGAIQTENTANYSYGAPYSWTGNEYRNNLIFNASKYNSIYSDSINIVQPPAISLKPQIRYKG